MFVAREEELSQLDGLLRANSSSFMVVYGRRRVGKTETVGFYSNKHNKIALKSPKMCKILSFIQYKT